VDNDGRPFDGRRTLSAMPVPPLVVVALTGALTVAALGGCGGDESDQPRPVPPYTASPSSPSSSTTPTPSATPSTPADLGRSAEDFVRAYYRELERANRSADPSRLESGFYNSACMPCQYDVRVLNDFRHKGHHIEGYGVSLDNFDVSKPRGNTIAVTVELRGHAGRVVDKNGKTVQELSATQSIRTDFILVRGTFGWRILDIVPLGEVKS